MAEVHQILTFKLNNLQLALDVDDVQEVLLKAEFQKVPLAPEFIEGLFTLRGQIVTGIDLKKRFGLKGEIGNEYAIIVIEKGTEYVGLIVDSVGEVEQVDTSNIQPLPANIKDEWKPWDSRVIHTEGKITILPDTEAILQT